MKPKFPRKKNRRSIFIIFCISILTASCLYYIIEKNIKPTISAMSEIKARLIATQVISDAVNKKIMQNSFNKIMDVKTDNIGRVTMVQANTSEMNRLAIETSLEIQNEIKDIDIRALKVPISSAFGSQILANVGPTISIDIQPAGSVSVDFKTDFEEAGINQTRLTVYLVVKTEVQIIIPLITNSIEVSSHIPVCESIIVGDVPESYINIPKEDSQYMNIIPNK